MKLKSLYGLALLASCVVSSAPVFAEDAVVPLSLARVIELSSADAPEVRIAATRIAEAKAKLAGAGVRTLENPKLDVAAGPRSGGDTSLDVEAGLEIPFELGERRGKRVAVAEAGIQREQHASDEIRRQAVASAVGAYYRVLQAEEGLRFARQRETLARDFLRIASERYAAGDAPKFEVNVAESEVALAESGVSARQRLFHTAATALAKTLGLPSARRLKVVGDIRDRAIFDALRAAAAPRERPDLKAALAEVKASGAAVALAQSERLPDLAFRVSYKREGSENVALGGITVSLPFVNPRKGALQEARVQQQRAELAAEARRAAIEVEVEGAQRAYDAAVDSVRQIEGTTLARLDENQELAAESYRAGKIGLATLLQLRREALETRQTYLERLLEAADAGVELASAYGTWSKAN